MNKSALRFACPFVFLFSAPLWSQDRTRELLNLGYIWNPSNEFHAYDAKLGVEMLVFKTGRWAAIGSVREADLELTEVHSTLHLKNYNLSLPVQARLSDNWFFIASPKLSVKNASHTHYMNGQTLYPSLATIFNYRNTANARWTLSLGFFYSKEIEEHFALPIISATYVDPPLRLGLGFPNFSVFYQHGERWELGLKANFDSSTYTLPQNSSLYSDASKGVRLRILDLGPAFNFKVTKNIWLNTNMGVVVLAEGHTVSERGTKRNRIYKGNMPLFFRLSMSYYPYE